MERYYTRSRTVASRVVAGEAVLVRMPDARLYCLNGRASRMWVRADGRATGLALADGFEPSVARAFLDEMVSAGLLERSSSPLEVAEAFPQNVVWPEAPPASEAPEIVDSQPVDTTAGCIPPETEIACYGLPQTFSV